MRENLSTEILIDLSPISVRRLSPLPKCPVHVRALFDFLPAPAFHFASPFARLLRRRVCIAPDDAVTYPLSNFDPGMESFRALPDMSPRLKKAAVIGRPSAPPLRLDGAAGRGE